MHTEIKDLFYEFDLTVSPSNMKNLCCTKLSYENISKIYIGLIPFTGKESCSFDYSATLINVFAKNGVPKKKQFEHLSNILEKCTTFPLLKSMPAPDSLVHLLTSLTNHISKPLLHQSTAVIVSSGSQNEHKRIISENTILNAFDPNTDSLSAPTKVLLHYLSVLTGRITKVFGATMPSFSSGAVPSYW